jgi:NADH-quinone oxidoreductase subunit E
MLRRLHADQPSAFAFTPANQAWAEAQMTKFPEGRQASAVIPCCGAPKSKKVG